MNHMPSETGSVDFKPSEALLELALDLRWSFNHSADKLWEQLNPELWDLTHNPWILVQTVSPQQLRAVTADPAFQKILTKLHREKRTSEESDAWFQSAHPSSSLRSVAYFSMEFMLSEALPIYSGGLGNVAGDQLKAASNLGVPVIGISLFYQQGYFRQKIDAQGQQQALYPFNDPGQLPMRPVRGTNGEWLRVAIDLPGTKLWLRPWQVQVGRRKLYLLDTNDPANVPADRSIASELYGGGAELRLKQELVLGLGGWQLLQALGLKPEVCHLNEGHAAFAVLARARSYMQETKQPFPLALAITRAGNVFTTHTPVAAGFDLFAVDLMEKYLRQYAEDQLSISFQDLLALGRRDKNDLSEPFNMAHLAVRGSGVVNGVSRLHGQVSRRIFQPLFPRWPEAEVPITHITNGVHMPTWDSAEADRVWESACGKHRWHGTMDTLERDLRSVSDAVLWQLRTASRINLINYARKSQVRQLATEGFSAEELTEAAQSLDPNTLTLGFARRFASYKRPNLLLQDPERLLRILTNQARPVQLVLAGKAHPDDAEGQKMIREWFQFSRRRDVRARVVFLSDYDLRMAAQLVQGADLWINTPRRPWEASGTSGMKVLVNGGLNLSELDGWWAEAYSSDVGWAIGDGQEHGDDPSWDVAEAEALYGTLEHEVIPEFYSRDNEGIPRRWVSRMRESMARLTPLFSTNRVVREYTGKCYLPASAAFTARSINAGALGSELSNWQTAIAAQWPRLRFGSAHATKEGDDYFLQVQLFLGDLQPEFVQVELYADPQNGESAGRLVMNRHEDRIGSENGFVYSLRIPARRPLSDYTPRVVPHRLDASVPLEAPFILWHDSPDWR